MKKQHVLAAALLAAVVGTVHAESMTQDKTIPETQQSQSLEQGQVPQSPAGSMNQPGQEAGMTPPAAPLSATEQKQASKVLSDLHRTNLMEIEIGQVAQSKGASEAVRNYGSMLVSDHQASQDEVENLAGQLGITLPDKDRAMAGKEHDKMMQLKKLEGAAFDRSFASSMVKDHKAAISRLEAAQKQSTGQVSALITQTLPVLRQHQQAAEQLVVDLSTPNRPS